MKRLLSKVCFWFELEDHEYIKATFGPWPFRFFVTILEPRWRRRWRKYQPWNLRCCVAGVLLDWMHRYCTVCGAKITLRELLARDGRLIRFMSGSACHRDCKREASRG